ncbi:transposase [Bacteroidia bacterium]|jgi:REP element-mobilizing transposase RayT|nr:transposase [Bacteroidia bacterium]
MSFVKVWIHAVWTTKRRAPLLIKEKRQIIFNHILDNGIAKGIYVDCVNGHKDHVHCLFKLRNDETIMKTMQMLKGESSYWANKNKVLPHKLYWQKEFYAVSVSESIVPNVQDYIQNQEEHHKDYSWEEEYNNFIKNYGFQVLKS